MEMFGLDVSRVSNHPLTIGVALIGSAVALTMALVQLLNRAGFFLGPIGILLSLANRTAECSACRKRIHPQATRCPYCQAELSALRPSR